MIEDPEGAIYLVTEYYPNGSLGDEIRRINTEKRLKRNKNYFEKPVKRGLPNWQVRNFLIDMLKSLHYCQKVIGVVHRDIKPDNIMINRVGEAVLIDFGLSATYKIDNDDKDNDYLDLKVGSYLFFAPELFNVETKTPAKFGPATDIWALGITVYYLLTGLYPWNKFGYISKLVDAITTQEIDFGIIQENTRHCLKRMLDKNPATRATIDELICIDWVTNSGKDLINVELIAKNNTLQGVR